MISSKLSKMSFVINKDSVLHFLFALFRISAFGMFLKMNKWLLTQLLSICKTCVCDQVCV